MGAYEMTQIKRLTNAYAKTNKAIDKRRIATMERMWVQDTPKINILNYWYYRYFTNEFILYILDAIQFEEKTNGEL